MGGTCKKYADRVQVMMNKASRYINNMGRRTHSEELMKKCKWMNFKDLTRYHSLVTMWKVVWKGTPTQTRRKLTIDAENRVTTSQARLQSTSTSWRWRTTPQWNSLPDELREIESLTGFKKTLKKWIGSNEDPMVPDPN